MESETGNNIFQEEIKEIITPNISKNDGELFHEEDHVVLPIIRVKSFTMPNKGIKWKIFSNNTILLTIDGIRLNKKERAFLKTVEGVNFLLNQTKIGNISFNSIRAVLKKKIIGT